jgi:IQ calmodulin-binding motif
MSNMTSWDEHYRRKGKTHEHFEFASDEYQHAVSAVNSDAASSPLLGAAGVATNGSGGGGDATDLFPPLSDEPKVLASAITYQPRPLPGMMSPNRNSSAQQQQQHHSLSTPSVGSSTAALRNSMFYPTAGLKAATITQPPPLSSSSSSSPSRNLSLAAAQAISVREFDDDQGLFHYYASQQQQEQQMKVKSTTMNNKQPKQHRPTRNSPMEQVPLHHTKTQQGANKAIYDPYEANVVADTLSSIPYQHQPYSNTPRRSTSVTGGGMRPLSSSSNRPTTNRQQEYYDFVRDNFIMFGDGIDGATASTGTGLSQEELLQRKRREDSWRRRKERRQHQQRKVQLPSSLLFGTSSSSTTGKSNTTAHATTADRSSHTLSTLDSAAAVVSPTPVPGNDNIDEFGLPLFYNSGIGMAEYKQNQDDFLPSTTASSPSQQPQSRNKPTDHAPPENDIITSISINSASGSADVDDNPNISLKDAGEKGVRFSVGTNDHHVNTGTSSTNKMNTMINSNKGSRSSMVRRQRGDKSSTGRRWKIVRVEEEPEGTRGNVEGTRGNVEGTTDQSNEGTKQTSKVKADPPVEDSRSIERRDHSTLQAANQLKAPIDPPSGSEHDRDPEQTLQIDPSDVVSEPSEVITEIPKSPFLRNIRSSFSGDSNDGSHTPAGLRGNAKDEFDRYMESSAVPTLTSPHRSNHELDKNLDMSEDEYITNTKRILAAARSSVRPSSANFTPKSEYSRSLSHIKNGNTTKTSPASVLDFQSPSVRWSVNLTQQEFVTPESVKLYPYSEEKVKISSSSRRPKSILRSNGNSRTRRETEDTDSLFTSNTNDCPSDESPQKRASGRASRTVGEVSEMKGLSSESPADIGFMDTSGRSVSPIPGDDTDEDIVNTMDGIVAPKIQLDRPERMFENTVGSKFQNAFIPDAFVGGLDNSGELSDSYVNFIEAVAAVVIQTKVRQYLASIRVKNIRYHRRVLGAEARKMAVSSSHVATNRKAKAVSSLAHSHPESPVDFLALAAIRIQAAFRGWWVRDCIAVDHYCATTIQKTYKGFLYRTRYLVLLYSIVTVQSLWRRQVARRRVQRRKMEILHYHTYNHAATRIQSKWRGFVCEMKYLRDYEAILVVQSISRGWIARRLIRSWIRTHETDEIRFNKGNKKAMKRSLKPSTPVRKPTARNDISPAYVNHIQYMMTTIANPPVKSEAIRPSTESSGNKPVERQLFTTDAQPWEMRVNDQSIDSLPVFIAPEDELFEGRSPLSTPNNSSGKAEASTPAWNTARIEIEKRRRQRELEAKALQDEEKRRKEAQAAELAELEMRRKRMALKAEARKREQEAAVFLSPSIKGTDQRSVSDIFSEEKKENDSFASPAEQRTVVAAPEATVGLPGGEVDHKSGSSGAGKLIAKWQQRSLGEGQLSSTAVVHIDAANSLTVKSPNAKTAEIIEALDEADKHVSPFSPRKISESVMNQKLDSADQAESSCSIGSPARCEDANITSYTTSSEDNCTENADGESKPRLRVSGSNATYQAHMLSQRTEEEQKRIDDIHSAFKKAGLMNRVKR